MPIVYSDGTTAAWVNWVTPSTATTTATDVWTVWADATTTTATTNSTTWVTWVTTTGTGSAEYVRRVPLPPPTPQELEARRQAAEAARIEAQRYAAEAERKRRAAKRRATVILMRNLTPEQRESYKLHKMFEVLARSGQRYRINRGRVANVDVLDEKGKVKHRLCAHPDVFCPDEDTMLAQKLMLENLEQEFVRTANVHRVRH